MKSINRFLHQRPIRTWTHEAEKFTEKSGSQFYEKLCVCAECERRKEGTWMAFRIFYDVNFFTCLLNGSSKHCIAYIVKNCFFVIVYIYIFFIFNVWNSNYKVYQYGLSNQFWLVFFSFGAFYEPKNNAILLFMSFNFSLSLWVEL